MTVGCDVTVRVESRLGAQTGFFWETQYQVRLRELRRNASSSGTKGAVRNGNSSSVPAHPWRPVFLSHPRPHSGQSRHWVAPGTHTIIPWCYPKKAN